MLWRGYLDITFLCIDTLVNHDLPGLTTNNEFCQQCFSNSMTSEFKAKQGKPIGMRLVVPMVQRVSVSRVLEIER